MSKYLYLLVFPAILLIFSACKEEKPAKAPCENGFLDAGETGIDCGGNCPSCTPVEIPLLYVECNGGEVNMTSKSLTYSNGSWALLISNDTLSIQIALGNSGTIGTFPLIGGGSYATKNTQYYMNCSNGIYAISAHNTTTHKMSGFFQADFSRTGFNDTLHVRNGQFEFLTY
jgi:hypothetical protein